MRIPKRLQSRKFWVAVGGAALIAALKVFVEADVATISAIAAIVLGYLGAQGYNDTLK